MLSNVTMSFITNIVTYLAANPVNFDPEKGHLLLHRSYKTSVSGQAAEGIRSLEGYRRLYRGRVLSSRWST
jgi:hypothetical protein